MYLRKFYEIGKIEFKTSYNYRLSFMASIVISPLILIMYYFVWSSVFKNSNSSIFGYSFHDMITYYVISMIVSHFIYNMVGNKLQEQILYGELANDLLKPMSVFSKFLSRELAERSFAYFAEVIPVFIIALIIFKLDISGVSIAFAISMFFAFFINFLIAFLMGMLAFWIHKIDAIQWFMFIFVRFASGEFLPLEFLGSTLFGISKFLPFYYLRYGVIELFLGRTTNVPLFLAIQIAWIIGLYLLIKIIWNFALKRFGAVGG